MPLTREKLVAIIKPKSMAAIDEVAQLVEAHDNCVALLVGIKNRDILGLQSISRFLFALCKKLLPADEVETVTLKHIAVLAFLERSLERGYDESKTRLISLYRNIFSKKPDGSYHDQCVDKLIPYIGKAISHDSSLKICVVGWLDANEYWQEAYTLAQTITHEDTEYHNALYFVGLYNILQDEASFPTFLLGLEALLSIPEAHEKHREKNKEVKDAINLARDNIRKEGQHGLVVTTHFSMFRNAKNPRKRCDIPDVDELGSGLTLHERQSLVERIVNLNGDLSKTKLAPTRYGDKYNHLVVNIGFIVTDRVWKKGGVHQRRFCTMPLLIDNKTCYPGDSHTEPTLFNFLQDETRLHHFIQAFKEKFSIKSVGHKVYGVVIDCHSTFDMCELCFNQTQVFYKGWRPLLLKKLEELGFIIPKEHAPGLFEFFNTEASIVEAKDISDNRHFSIIMRFSSNCTYEKVRQRKPVIEKKVDIRCSDRHLLLHGSAFWHGRWTGRPRPVARQPEIPVENWTVISTGRAPAAYTAGFNYSHLGKLDLRHYGLWQAPTEGGVDELTSKTRDMTLVS